MSLFIVVEGDTDLPVARKLAADAGLEVAREIDCGGKDALDGTLPEYNDAAKGTPWLVLRDLDRVNCAPTLLATLGIRPARWMCLRVVIREMEAWLLADSEAIAAFLAVSPSKIPTSPDTVDDPTTAIVNLARTSRRAAVKKAIVPRPGHSVEVGPLFEAKMIEFATCHWDLDRACARSDSLRRARAALRLLGDAWRGHVSGAHA